MKRTHMGQRRQFVSVSTKTIRLALITGDAVIGIKNSRIQSRMKTLLRQQRSGMIQREMRDDESIN